MSEASKYYDKTYASFADKVLQDVRYDAFGEDIGQNSWLLADEFRRFFTLLKLGSSSNVLEVASGSGGPACYLARSVGCLVTGIDLNPNAVGNANKTAKDQGLNSLANFLQADASEPLRFEDEAFDAIYCIDSVNHFHSRPQLLKEWNRVLKRGARLLFTNPITVTGIISNEEVAVRSSIGYFLFTPPAEDERLIRSSGFNLLSKEDSTENVVTISKRWLESRSRHRDDLIRIESEQTFTGTQRFLDVAYTVSKERRLSRFTYVAEKQ